MQVKTTLKIFFLACVAVAVIAAWIFVIRTDVQKKNTKPDIVWTPYQNTIDRYTLNYPSDWIVEGVGPITIVKRSGEASYTVSIAAEPNANNLTAKDWADVYSKNPKVGETVQPEERSLGQQTAYFLTDMSLNSGMKDMVIVVANETVYTMTFPSKTSTDGVLNAAENNAIARQIIDTMKW